MEQRPVFVFDSGFGGISVLKKLVEYMPNEDFWYLGDSANAPYGSRPQQEICVLTLRAVASVISCDPKAIVIACNTATAAAGEMVAAVYPHIPVIGIRPAVQDAAEDAANKRILVLATVGTLASAAFAAQLEQISGDIEIVSLAAPGIVRYVEGEMKDRSEVVRYLKKLLQPHQERRFDAVVLGCTHFPFAADAIRDALGYPVRFYDGSERTARQTASILQQTGTANSKTRSGSVRIINSAEQQTMLRFAWKLFSVT